MGMQGAPGGGGRNGFIFMAVIFILFGLLLAFFIGNRVPGLFEFLFGEPLGEPTVESPKEVEGFQPDTTGLEENNQGSEPDRALTAIEIIDMGGSIGGVISQTNENGAGAGAVQSQTHLGENGENVFVEPDGYGAVADN